MQQVTIDELTYKELLEKEEILSKVVTKDTNPKDLVGQTKANIFLVPPASIIAEAEAMMDGASKYEPYNWRQKGVRASVYLSAANRHLMSFLDGEDYATDSGVHHLGHAKACLGILLDALSQGNLVDDRPVKGGAPRLLKEVHVKNETKVNKNSKLPANGDSYQLALNITPDACPSSLHGHADY